MDNEHIGLVEVVRPFFKAGHRWGLSDGQKLFGADIEDQTFMKQVESGERVFGKGDALKVKLRTRAWRDDDGKLQSKTVVTEVVEVLPAPHPVQRSLLPGPKKR